MAARTKETPKVDAEVTQAPVEKSAGFVVTAAMVTAWDVKRDSFTLMHGDLVTDRVAPDSLEHLKSLGFVREA